MTPPKIRYQRAYRKLHGRPPHPRRTPEQLAKHAASERARNQAKREKERMMDKENENLQLQLQLKEKDAELKTLDLLSKETDLAVEAEKNAGHRSRALEWEGKAASAREDSAHVRHHFLSPRKSKPLPTTPSSAKLIDKMHSLFGVLQWFSAATAAEIDPIQCTWWPLGTLCFHYFH